MLFDHVRRHLFLRVSSIVRIEGKICKMIIKNNKFHLHRFARYFIHKLRMMRQTHKSMPMNTMKWYFNFMIIFQCASFIIHLEEILKYNWQHCVCSLHYNYYNGNRYISRRCWGSIGILHLNKFKLFSIFCNRWWLLIKSKRTCVEESRESSRGRSSSSSSSNVFLQKQMRTLSIDVLESQTFLMGGAELSWWKSIRTFNTHTIKNLNSWQKLAKYIASTLQTNRYWASRSACTDQLVPTNFQLRALD